MKQTIEIEVPDGKTAVWKEGKIVFDDIELQLLKTWKEFCEQNEIKKGECFIDFYCCIKEKLVSTRHEIIDRNLLPNKQAAEQHLALMQLHQLRDYYRQGWKPDYLDNSYKWGVVKYKGKLSIDCMLNCSIFLSFQTKELAEQFLTNFKDLIEQAGDLI